MKKLALILGCIIYVLSPIDFIPDPLVGPGFIDDIIAIVMTYKSVTAHKE